MRIRLDNVGLYAFNIGQKKNKFWNEYVEIGSKTVTIFTCLYNTNHNLKADANISVPSLLAPENTSKENRDYQSEDALLHGLRSDVYMEANNLRFELNKNHQGR